MPALLAIRSILIIIGMNSDIHWRTVNQSALFRKGIVLMHYICVIKIDPDSDNDLREL